MMKLFVAAAMAMLMFSAERVQANDWHAGPGVAYVSKIDDVVDAYKANLNTIKVADDMEKSLLDILS